MTSAEAREATPPGPGVGGAFGALLRTYRLAHSFTQEELAERAGLGVRSVSALECGAPHTPRKETVRLLAAALSLTGGEQAALEEAARRMGRARGSRQTARGHAGPPAQGAAPPQPQAPTPVAAPAHLVWHNLPVPLTTFVGRQQLLVAVSRLLRETGEAPRLVTLTGVGGGGKTRLALQVVHGLLDAAVFPDGIAFVGLAPLADPEQVVPTIARTLGVPDAPGHVPLVSLQEHLRDRKLLLVLDNMEHLLPAAPALTALLSTCPSLRVLATSRAPLRLYGEREVPVPPLDVPASRGRLSVEELAAYDAVRLFVARAQDVAPTFALTEQNSTMVAALCQRLDGLPLALELAASRSKVLSPAAILARLERRLPLLTRGARDLPARHQSLRGTIAWSYELLTPEEQALFRRLGIFSGGCTLEAASTVCLTLDRAPEAVLDALDGITELVDKSLLRQQEPAGSDGAAEEPRFLMLETVREYAREQLIAHGELAEVQQRHAAYFSALASTTYDQLGSAEVAPWLPGLNTAATSRVRLIEHDYANLQSALQWTIAHGGAAQGARLAIALAPFWAITGRAGEGRPWMAALLALPDIADQPALRSDLRRWAAELAIRHGDYTGAQALQEELLLLCRQAGDRRGEAMALRCLGLTMFCLGDAEGAHRCAVASLALWRALGDPQGIADALVQLSDASLDGTMARPLLEESLQLARAAHDQGTTASVLAALAQLATDERDFARAHALVAESRAMVGDSGDRWALNGVLYACAWLALGEANHEEARLLLTQILTFWREIGMAQTYPALALLYAARLAAAEGQPERALRLAAAATRLAGTPLPVGFRPHWAAVRPELERARRAVGEATYEVVTAEGQAMSLTQVIAYALGEPAST